MVFFKVFYRFVDGAQPIFQTSQLDVGEKRFRLLFALFRLRAFENPTFVGRGVRIFQYGFSCREPCGVIGFSQKGVFQFRLFERRGIPGELPVRSEDRLAVSDERGRKFRTSGSSERRGFEYGVVDEAIGFRTVRVRFGGEFRIVRPPTFRPRFGIFEFSAIQRFFAGIRESLPFAHRRKSSRPPSLGRSAGGVQVGFVQKADVFVRTVRYVMPFQRSHDRLRPFSEFAIIAFRKGR